MSAQPSSECNTNEKNKINSEIASLLCKFASKRYDNESGLYSGISNLTPFESVLMAAIGKHKEARIMSLEGHKNRHKGINSKINVPTEWKIEAGKWWNEKGHKCYCKSEQMDYVAYDGYLNFHLLKTGQVDFLIEFYNPNGDYQANLNLIVPLNPCNENSLKATFLDIIQNGINNPVGQMHVRNDIVKNFKALYNWFSMPKYGGVTACQIQPDCVGEYKYLLNSMFRNNLVTTEIENRYKELLQIDIDFKSKYQYYHNLLRLKRSEDLENHGELFAINYKIPSNSDYSANSIEMLTLSMKGDRRAKKIAPEVCAILSKYDIASFALNNGERDFPNGRVNCN